METARACKDCLLILICDHLHQIRNRLFRMDEFGVLVEFDGVSVFFPDIPFQSLDKDLVLVILQIADQIDAGLFVAVDPHFVSKNRLFFDDPESVTILAPFIMDLEVRSRLTARMIAERGCNLHRPDDLLSQTEKRKGAQAGEDEFWITPLKKEIIVDRPIGTGIETRCQFYQLILFNEI